METSEQSDRDSYLIIDSDSDSDVTSKHYSKQTMSRIGSQVTLELLKLRNQVKVIHWQTEGYAEHKALDKLFDLLNSQNDRWVETFMGKYGRVHFGLGYRDIDLKNIDQLGQGIVPYLKDWIKRLNQVRDLYFNRSVDSDLSNIFDEIFGEINKSCYLLSLH